MNSDKQALTGQRGNALIYVIIALALLGALTMLLTKQSGESDDLSYETNELLVLKTTAFAAAAKNTVDQMMMSGTQIGNLIYTKPNAPAVDGFDTPPHYNKVFHPEGGGLTLSAVSTAVFEPDHPVLDSGWYMGRFNNIEWTPSTAQDILLVAFNINEPLCAAINRKVKNDPSIPIANAAGNTIFIDTSYTGDANVDLTEALCPDCDDLPSLCVQDLGGQYVYYNIISAQ